MGSNSLGKEFVITSFGESHGDLVGVVVDGCPAGLSFSADDVQADLDRRIPTDRPELVSGRIEKDIVALSSGVFEGFTTGAPICMTVQNKETISKDYESLKNLPRPGHADYTARIKYGGFNDYRGGGRFSGRVTVALIMAGAVAKKLLANFGVDVLAYTRSIGSISADVSLSSEEIRKRRNESAVRCLDLACSEAMAEEIIKAKGEGESVGGVIECLALNVPVGVGEPLYDALDADMAKNLFVVPAVKGVEFGSGFEMSRLRGSQSNDGFRVKAGKVVSPTNLAGGILGGLSSGMPIVVRVAVKPTPSISKEQETVDLSSMKASTLKVEGRHDPCVVPKAVPVVEAVVALSIVDQMIRGGFIPRVLKERS